jgi:hypothetical protein
MLFALQGETMRSYKADLSRRLGPVFAEQAAQPKTTSDRNLPANLHRVVVPLSAAYNPPHGGYPDVKARA